MRRWRLLWLLAAAAMVAAAYSGWSAWQVRADLVEARAAAARLQAAVEAGSTPDRREAVGTLQDAAGRAHDRTDGPWWAVLSWIPVVGDDVRGVRALSASADRVAHDGLVPMLDALATVDEVVADGRIDPDAVRRLERPVTRAAVSFRKAADLVRDLDSSGYARPIRGEFDEYVDLVTRADRTLASASTATVVLPTMLGGDAPRDYLLLVQNNAEIRGSGGMPGSWAQLHADDGQLGLVRQGSPRDFPRRMTPVLPLSPQESRTYGMPYGTFFQNVGFAPDFPRTAELARGHWDLRFPDAPLDGVIAVDPVALGYLLEGAGPVRVWGRSLTAGNAAYELLNRPYLELTVPQQDAFFAAATESILDAVTTRLADPRSFVDGMARAADEGRLLVAAFDADEATALEGTRVEGVLTGDDGSTPHLDLGLNAATASKMSYYLRHELEVEATGCAEGRQTLHADLRLRQTISPDKAASLPDYLAGAGTTVEPGEQLLLVPVYGPHDGTIDRIRVDDRAVRADVREHDGRPVVVLVAHLSTTRPVTLSWRVTTGEGQSDATQVRVTPGVEPAVNAFTVPSAC